MDIKCFIDHLVGSLWICSPKIMWNMIWIPDASFWYVNQGKWMEHLGMRRTGLLERYSLKVQLCEDRYSVQPSNSTWIVGSWKQEKSNHGYFYHIHTYTLLFSGFQKFWFSKIATPLLVLFQKINWWFLEKNGYGSLYPGSLLFTEIL